MGASSGGTSGNGQDPWIFKVQMPGIKTDNSSNEALNCQLVVVEMTWDSARDVRYHSRFEHESNSQPLPDKSK